MLETLDALRRKGFRLAVVTNKPVFATKKILEALSLAEFFPVVIGGDSVKSENPIRRHSWKRRGNLMSISAKR